MTRYYLNQEGSRTYTQGQRVYFVDNDGNVIDSRAVDYEYAFGNFSGISFRYKGKRYHELPNSIPYVSQRIEVDAYRVIKEN